MISWPGWIGTKPTSSLRKTRSAGPYSPDPIHAGARLAEREAGTGTLITKEQIMRTFDLSHCARCLRVPETENADDLSSEYGDDPRSDWEPLTDGECILIGIVCPDCITPEERQALDEDAIDHLEGGDQ